MTKIAGVTTKKDAKGNLTHVTISAKKHPEAIDKLKELGLIEESEFEKDCANALLVEEARQVSINYLRSIWSK